MGRSLWILSVAIICGVFFAPAAPAAPMTPEPGGRYSVRTEIGGECHDFLPDPLPDGQFEGQQIEQKNKGWSVKFDTATWWYTISADPDGTGCVPLVVDSTPPFSHSPQRPGLQTYAVTEDIRTWEWTCLGICGEVDGFWKLVDEKFDQVIGQFNFRFFETYHIELASWIAQARVVDPFRLRETRYSRLAKNCFTPRRAFRRTTRVRSFFRGDGHTTFPWALQPGRFRVKERANLEWDGESVTLKNHEGIYGVTHRDFIYTGWTRPLTKRKRCSLQDRATEATATLVENNEFRMELEAADPMIPLNLAPDIDSDLTGTFSEDGALTLTWSTDLFPMHGILVSSGGLDLPSILIVGNSSCLPVLGPAGAAHLFVWLNSQTNDGQATIPWRQLSGLTVPCS